MTNTQICFILLQIYYFRLLVRSFDFQQKKYLERDHVKLESPFSVRIWKVRKDNLVLGIFRMTHKPLNGSNNDVTLCTELLMNASNRVKNYY